MMEVKIIITGQHFFDVGYRAEFNYIDRDHKSG